MKSVKIMDSQNRKALSPFTFLVMLLIEFIYNFIFCFYQYWLTIIFHFTFLFTFLFSFGENLPSSAGSDFISLQFFSFFNFDQLLGVNLRQGFVI